MFKVILALSAVSQAFAATTVATRKSYSQCDAAGVAFGTATVMSSVKNGCSALGYLDCTAKTFTANTTEGATSCPTKRGTVYNTTGTCQAVGNTNTTLTCVDVDGTQYAEVGMWTGNACNGTQSPFGVIGMAVCTYLTPGVFVKMWTNSTGSFVGKYATTGCGSDSLDTVVQVTMTGTSGCTAASLQSGYSSVSWALLEAPTSAPTVAGNKTNTTAPGSSSTVVVASLASAVLAAASLML
jgi:hypothetical protein